MPAVDLQHGHFSWVDLITTDLEAGTAFYRDLLGWTPEPSPMSHGSYVMFRKNGAEVAGAIAMPPGSEQEFPPCWVSYILVDDLDRALEAVPGLGGAVLTTRDIEGAGRMGMIQDPTGGAVGLWEDVGFRGARLFNEPSALSWNELVTRDVEAALEFYGALLGWGWQDMPMPDGSVYKVALVGDRPNGGIMEMTPAWPDHVPAHWAVYFQVEDVDAAMARALELGGQHLHEAEETPVGRIGVAADGQGAPFSFFRPVDRG